MAALESAAKTGGKMPLTIEQIARQLGDIGALNTPEEAAAAIGLLEQLSLFMPEPAGRLASAGLLLARDLALAGRGAESIEELRSSIRASWQAEIDRRFGK
jgi:hypothetical protein